MEQQARRHADGNREREREEGATKGPKSGGSLGPPVGHDLWRVPANYHEAGPDTQADITDIDSIIEINGGWIATMVRCRWFITKEGREGREGGRKRRPPRGGTTDILPEITITGGISVAIGTAIIPRGGRNSRGGRNGGGGGGILSSGTG